MINVLIPAGGKSLFFKESYFPKPIIEIEGKTMMERVVENFKDLKDRHFIFVFDQKDCLEFHLDESARILTQPDMDVIILENETAGALCTCMMAVKYIGNDEPLIIANCDQIIDVDYQKVLNKFAIEGDGAGVVTFESIHPRWSYAKIVNGEVVEVAEKRPLSKHAIAGFFYYHKGSDFIEAAKKVILKGETYRGKYYISSTVNEIILKGEKVGFYETDRENYHSFYSPEKIKEYESSRMRCL